ncbi:MAG: C25 family cysteine peptidase [bacterium]
MARLPLTTATVLLLALFALLIAASPARAQSWLQSRYVIVCPDRFVPAVRPLAEWKTLKGLNAVIVPLSQAGRTPTEVRGFLRHAWQNWPEPPGWVLIACSPDSLPGFEQENDSYYGDMAGDYLMELPVGRLPCRSAAECSVMVAKSIAWERFPELLDTLWYLKGTTIVSQEDTSRPDPFYEQDSRHARQLWLGAGYVRAESLSNATGHSTADVVAALHDGRTFLTYRGAASGFWSAGFYDFRPHNWSNGRRMPIVVSATCATVTLAPYEEMLGDECLRYGSASGRDGMVAFFGTAQLGMQIAQYRSAAYRGFFDAVFTEGRRSLGDATLRARFRVDSLYRDETRYWEWALLGDPELCVWTGVPRAAEVSHDSVHGLGPGEYRVSVSRDGQPVSGALVCFALDSAAYCRDTTDSSGRAVFEPAAVRPGIASITVTGPNLRPYEGTCSVLARGRAFISYLRHELNDSPPGGNGNGSLSPGETVGLPVWAVNYGDSSARAVTGVLRTSDTLVALLDSVRRFGDIAGLDTGWTGADGFRFRVSNSCPDRHEIAFVLRCRDTLGDAWESRFQVPVGALELAVDSYCVFDSSGNGNGRLDPRETAELAVVLLNRGSGAAQSVSAVLRSADPRLAVIDSTGYYDVVPAYGSAGNDSDRFRVSAAFMLPETELACTLYLSAHGFADTLGLVLHVGRIGPHDPIPDAPGRRYWAYDDVDTAYAEHPSFEWVELRDVGTMLPLGDNQTASVPLPPGFGPFVYYDRRYDSVSVCSNGWLAPGAVAGTWWQNRRLPYAAAAPLLAVNWDDLIAQFGGGVWYHWDSAGHRFVVQWDSTHYRTPLDSFDTFQVVIYDTTLAAADGNSEFVYQYRTAHHYRSSTVGTQDPTRQIAINVVYDNEWDRAAAGVAPGRAIKFTTDPPVSGVFERAAAAVRLPGRRFPTIVRGVLSLDASLGHDPGSENRSGSCPTLLLDITGRKVMDLAPGENDVRRLARGVYFIRRQDAGESSRLVLVE